MKRFDKIEQKKGLKLLPSAVQANKKQLKKIDNVQEEQEEMTNSRIKKLGASKRRVFRIDNN